MLYFARLMGYHMFSTRLLCKEMSVRLTRRLRARGLRDSPPASQISGARNYLQTWMSSVFHKLSPMENNKTSLQAIECVIVLGPTQFMAALRAI